jgi:predicted RNase H-like nuclease (RuvC/YqgF family)
MSKKKITLEYLNEDIERLARITKGYFEKIEEKMATKEDIERLDGKIEALDGRIETLDGRIETLDGKIEQVEESLSKQIRSLRGDLILIIRKENKKMEELISILKEKNILSNVDMKKLAQIKVFPRIEILG